LGAWGIVGFTLSNGELGRMLQQIDKDLPQVFSDAFGHWLQSCGLVETTRAKPEPLKSMFWIVRASLSLAFRR
jgi:hypothetical protein